MVTAALPRKRADWAPLEYRFFLRVEKTAACWLWNGPLRDNGYGRFSVGQNSFRAHRWLWAHTHGSIPSGQEVRHLCDVSYPNGDITYRRCVNPDHLTLGTHAENMKDMTDRGRQAVGLRVARAKLSDDDVRAARAMRLAGSTVVSIAKAFGVNDATMSRILRRIHRRHVL